MGLDILSVLIGLVILVIGGEGLVRGVVNLALRLGIPALVVGLTVVSFGTLAPELIVSVNAALNGQPGIAVGPLTWWHGLILLGGLALMLWDNLRIALAHRAATADDPKVEGADPDMRWWKIGVYIAAGLLFLTIGARLLVDGAVNIATDLGVSETVIGLTLVAIGTSMPELVTSIVAAFRGHADVAMGNVIGSNTFNILGILGVTSLVADVPVDRHILTYDNWVMIGVSLLLVPFVLFRRDITRWVGVAFIGVYTAYAVSVVS